MTEPKMKLSGTESVATQMRGRDRGLTVPRAIGIASLVAAGCCACWLRASGSLPAASPLRVLGMIVVCAYLISATSLLLEER